MIRIPRRPWIWLPALLTALLSAPAHGQLSPKVPKWAKVKAVKTVLFPLRNKTVPSLTAEVVALAKSLGQQVQAASLSPEEVMLAVGCNSTSVGCLQKIGKMIKAPALILGSVKPIATGVHLELRRFDVESGGDAGKTSVDLPLPPTARRPKLLRAIRALFGIPEPPPPVVRRKAVDGELVITCSIPNASISLDGQRRGAAPLRLSGLPPGTYTIGASKRGYHRWSGKVKVVAGRTHRLRIMLQRSITVVNMRGGFFGSIQPQTWIVGGLGLASMAVGIGFAAHLGSQQNEFDRVEGNTPAEINELRDLKDTGERDALVANVMFAVGGVLVATAAFLAYLDYRRGTPPESEPKSPGVAPRKAKPKRKRARLQLGLGSLRYTF